LTPGCGSGWKTTEELEQEIDDNRTPAEQHRLLQTHKSSSIYLGIYFRESLRLQGELVKLQDWVVHKGSTVTDEDIPHEPERVFDPHYERRTLRAELYGPERY